MKKTYMILLAIFFSSLSMIAQEEKDENKGEKKEKEKKSISDLTESSNKIEGLFTIYQDSISGDLKMIVSKNQLGKEFIHFSQIADGVTDAGRFRGSYNDGTIFYIKKHFNKIEFIAPNTNFYFDPNNPISNSKNANISEAIFYSTKPGQIVAKVLGAFSKNYFSKMKISREPEVRF